MKIFIKNFFKIKEACIEGKGVHFVAGPGSSGKTAIKRAIAWGLTGKGSAPLSAEVTIENDRISIKRTVSADGSQSVTAISKDTGEILEIQDALGRMGFKGNTANIYTCDIGSDVAPDSINTPSTVILKNGKPVDVSTLNIDKCEAAYKQLLAEKETTSLLIKGLSANKEKLIADMEKVKKELIDLKAYAAKQKAVNDERIFLSLMERMECPLYSLQCEVDEKLITTAIEDKKAYIEKLQHTFDAGAIKDVVRQIECKERELISIEERLKLMEMPDVSIAPAPPDGDNHPTLADRMKELLDRIEDGGAVLDAARRFKAFCSDAIKVDPELLSAKGAALGINVTMEDGHLTINSMPYEQASMTEKTLALFSVQEALRAPIIICDGIYALDAQSRGRLIKHAVDAKPEGLVLFLGTKSEKPMPAKGVTCWFLDNGILKAVKQDNNTASRAA